MTAFRVSDLEAVLFPVITEAFPPAPLHVQVILGSDPEQRPGAVQVSVVCRPSAIEGTITAGFCVRTKGRAVHECNSPNGLRVVLF